VSLRSIAEDASLVSRIQRKVLLTLSQFSPLAQNFQLYSMLSQTEHFLLLQMKVLVNLNEIRWH